MKYVLFSGIFLGTIAVLIVADFGGACRPATMAAYQRVDTGMSYAQVAAILGCKGTQTVSGEVGGYKGAIYSWNGFGGGLGGNMTVQFSNDAVVMKSQLGLR